MALKDRDSVTFTRFTKTSVNDFGEAVNIETDTATTGNFQMREGDAQAFTNGAGLRVEVDAVFYSWDYHAGRVGDKVTYDGDTYRVVAVSRRKRIFGTGYRHSRYGLTREGSTA
jgi:hypothetical protein